MLKTMLLAGAATMIAAPSAFAQAPSGQGDTASEVVVTSSRIVRNGFNAPTPTTVLGQELVRQSMNSNITQTLNDLPQFSGTGISQERAPSVSASPGTAGVNTVNLRGLGVTRTLVLFDGQRVVNGSTGGGVDISILPAALVQRVDVVTGGASAAWGSDAIAGVVNFVLNKNFTGVDASLQGQRSWQGDDSNYKAEISVGRSLLNDRAHVVGSFAYSDHPGTVYDSDRTDWYKARRIVQNPAYTATNGQPRLITVNNTAQANVTAGGVISTGLLKNTQFGLNGAPMAYNPGNVSGTLSFGGDEDDLQGQHVSLSAPIREATGFGYFSYNITDHVKASLQVNWGFDHASNEILPYVRVNNVTIRNDNPYLDAGLLAKMNSLGVTSFTLGTTNTELGWTTGVNERTLKRGVFTLEGDLGKTWSWSAYYQDAAVLARSHIDNNWVIANYNLATDAVRNPANGQIVCRSTLTDPNNGCVPLNVMGTGVQSPAAIGYLTRNQTFQHITLKQEVAAASLRGDLFSLPAGPISVATGIEGRKENSVAQFDPISNALGYYVGNNKDLSGEVSVKEGFIETVVPIVKDMTLFKQLDFNGAARETDYSSSGAVTTWKAGLSWTVYDDLRLRGTRSRDIRAPSVTELFNPASNSSRIIPDPFTNTQPSVRAITKGNPNLKPENADTISYGFVYSPSWFKGLTGSIDYYKIDIAGAIGSETQENVILYCFQGQTAFCPLVIRDSSGQVVEIDSSPTNTQTAGTVGFDFEAHYTHPLMGGNVQLNALGNYTQKSTRSQNGAILDAAGQISASAPVVGQPKLRIVYSGSFDKGPARVGARVRYIGDAKLVNAWVNGVDIDNNDVKAIAYLDLNGSYNIGHAQLSFSVDNLLDTAPRYVPAAYNTNSPYIRSDTSLGLYDAIGREFRVGLRLRY